MPEEEKARAKKLVESIAKDHGHLGEHVYAKMDAETRREVEEAFLKKDEIIGSSVITLAKNLYTKDVRFIFELLQNADDNQFSISRDEWGDDPELVFRVYPDRIVVLCNEDGFKETHLLAICNIGQSSRKEQKDILARRASVLNRFSRWPGKTIFSPEDEEMPKAKTKMTFYLHEGGDMEAREAQRKEIADQFRDLKPKMLLFLKQLRCVAVTFLDSEGNEEEKVIRTIEEGDGPHRAVLEEMRTGKSRKKVEHKRYHYHVTRERAHGLARNENRNSSVEEERTQAYGSADVVLAFPVSAACVPITKPQDIFAFLPVCQVGFNFLVHTDFVTLANREGVSTTSQRNRSLRKGIANAFVTAVYQMCEHPQLRYLWMRYLPILSDNRWDPFWRVVVDMLKEQVAGADVLFCRYQLLSSIRSIERLRHVTPSFRDQHGDPLLDDIASQPLYVSKCYELKDVEILRTYGLQDIKFSEIIARVEADLKRIPSKMKSPETDSNWHMRVANRLIHTFSENHASNRQYVRELNILPLSDGRWIRSPPVTLTRRRLFAAIGVQSLTSSQVRSLVLRKYDDQRPIPLLASTSYLRFLYLTHPKNHSSTNYSSVSVCDSKMVVGLVPQREDVYLPDTTAYGPSSLGLSFVPFIHENYLNGPPERPTADSALWEDWLYRYIGLRRHLRLVSKDGSSISKECLFVAKNLPSKFLGLLKSLWPLEGSKVASNDSLCRSLSACEVMCEGSKMMKLQSTFLPIPGLRQLRSRFMENAESFPFLKLEPPLTEANASRWDFLDPLGVGRKDDLSFYLAILRWIKSENGGCAYRIQRSSRILDIYVNIHAKCVSSNTREDDEKRVQNELHDSLLFLPKCDNRIAFWTSPNRCVLNGPSDMMSFDPIDQTYKNVFAPEAQAVNTVMQFFQDTLRISSSSWRNHVADLMELKKAGWTDQGRISSRYERLKSQPTETKSIRNDFELHGLVFVASTGDTSWIKPSECLWSTGTEIRGKTNLATQYGPELKDFFLDMLGVTILNLSMVFDELMSLVAEQTTVKKAQLRASNTEFAIADRKQLAEMFRGKVKMLDFTMKEVCDLNPFLEWAGLTNRYLSNIVKDCPVLDSGEKWSVSDPRFDIRRKAHGIVRIATHFKSPRVQGDGKSLYDLLRASTTWETNCISSELSIEMDRSCHREKRGQSEVYIDDSGTLQCLKIYIPHDERTQDVAIQHTLPEKLAQWLMSDPSREKGTINVHVVGIVKGLLNARMSSVATILEMAGMVDIDLQETPLEEENFGVASATPPDRTEPVIPNATVNHLVPSVFGGSMTTLPVRPVTPAATASESTMTTLVRRPVTPATTSSNSTDVVIWGQETPLTDPLSYGSPSPAARQIPPSQGYFRFSDPFNTNEGPSPRPERNLATCLRSTAADANDPTRSQPWDASFVPFTETSLFGSATQDRDTMVGAAGELFVFEMLMVLDPALSDFSWENNWKSTIRRHVSVHPDYADLTPWRGTETVDLEYKDINGMFTTLLISKGHLIAAKWQGKKPAYYLEVKSTPSACSTSFFMSGTQYKKMKKYSSEENSIYIIFRVFNIYWQSIDARLYVDPIELEREGRLEFSADRYSVRPSSLWQRESHTGSLG
ncbi:hypothetical protein B0H66DRAFT_628718 [Apodospora peruviana]|uniref:Uncharacterized protein n=1 Tax=Apodospora peruviana TaxID=516989 RepID=A0AAE0HZ81_9PEZI|nr:hypothetical protein B0H66DRAFT_628718 [Apodospora peruviana]